MRKRICSTIKLFAVSSRENMIEVHGNDVIAGRAGHLEDISHIIDRAGDFLAETAISGILVRIRPASLTGRFDPVADLYRLRVVVEIMLMFAVSRRNDECRMFHDMPPILMASHVESACDSPEKRSRRGCMEFTLEFQQTLTHSS